MEMIFGSNMSNGIENIKRAMKEPGIEIISFDVFDTLVVRPLERSTDVFELLDKMFGEMSDASISFHKLRNEAESVLRRRIIRGEYPAEDITLTDIYKLLHDEFGIDKHITDSLMQEEISIECKLLRPRESGSLYAFLCLNGTDSGILLRERCMSIPMMSSLIHPSDPATGLLTNILM